MAMSYFPDRRSGVDPPNIADALSESLSNQYGSWNLNTFFGQSVSLDPHAAVGNSAVATTSPSRVVCEEGALYFDLSSPLNLKSFERFQFMIAAFVGGNNNLTGDGQVWLIDSNGYGASVSFQFAKGQKNQPVAYSTKTFVQSDFTISEINAPFDWSNIMHVNFLFGTQNLNPYSWDGFEVLLDGGPFFLLSTVPDGILIVASKPTGVTNNTFVLADGTYPFTTPIQLTRPIGTPVTIQMGATDQTGDAFNHWDDLPSTDPQYSSVNRQWTFQMGTSTLIAVYGSALLPALSIDSYDQNMKNYPATGGIKFVFSGIEDFHDLPFGGRVSKGTYTFVPQNTSERTFKYWLMPNGIQKTDAYITIDVEADTKIEVHWSIGTQTSTYWLPLAIISLVIGGGVAAYFAFGKKP